MNDKLKGFVPPKDYFKGHVICASLGPNRERTCPGDGGGPITREDPNDGFRSYLMVNAYKLTILDLTIYYKSSIMSKYQKRQMGIALLLAFLLWVSYLLVTKQ